MMGNQASDYLHFAVASIVIQVGVGWMEESGFKKKKKVKINK